MPFEPDSSGNIPDVRPNVPCRPGQGTSGSAVFSLDLEDHLGQYSRNARYVTVTRRVLDLLDGLGIRGTFFTVARVAETEPALVREVAARGHEIACHSYDHTPITQQTAQAFGASIRRSKTILEDVTGVEVIGYRAPIFSMTPATPWAADELASADYIYSSSVLPAANPLFGYSGAPRVPFRWPSGLAEFPCPLLSLGKVALPFLGGIYFRYLPWPLVQLGLARLDANAVPWCYIHPYDFDVEESFGRMPGTALWVNLICWMNRRPTEIRVRRLYQNQTSQTFREIMNDSNVVFTQLNGDAAVQPTIMSG